MERAVEIDRATGEEREPTGGPTPLVFLLSPATLRGVRGRRILEGTCSAGFMETLHAGGRVPLGEVYTFISSLYFRGKWAYAAAFGRPGTLDTASWVVTPDLGLLPAEHPVDMETLRRFASVDIDPSEPAYLEPLRETASAVGRELGSRGRAVLLGSIASGKYVEPLAGVLGRALLFPEAFVGRGDMSRGGLLLRAAAAGEELGYVVAADAPRRGSRPPKLDPGTRVSG
jgi:hypothetical protein